VRDPECVCGGWDRRGWLASERGVREADDQRGGRGRRQQNLRKMKGVVAERSHDASHIARLERKQTRLTTINKRFIVGLRSQ
jgi:hypothetical protein